MGIDLIDSLFKRYLSLWCDQYIEYMLDMNVKLSTTLQKILIVFNSLDSAVDGYDSPSACFL